MPATKDKLLLTQSQTLDLLSIAEHGQTHLLGGKARPHDARIRTRSGATVAARCGGAGVRGAERAGSARDREIALGHTEKRRLQRFPDAVRPNLATDLRTIPSGRFPDLRTSGPISHPPARPTGEREREPGADIARRCWSTLVRGRPKFGRVWSTSFLLARAPRGPECVCVRDLIACKHRADFTRFQCSCNS